jgi:hypothetical protein
MSSESTTPKDQSEGTAEWKIRKEKAEAERDTAKAAFEAQKILATQQLEIVKAQQGLLSQLLPKGESKPLEGKVDTGDKFEALGELVAHRALANLGGHLAKHIAKLLTEGAKVLIVDQLDYASGEIVLKEVQAQLTGFSDALQTQINDCEAILYEHNAQSVGETSLAIPIATVLSILPLAQAAISSLSDIIGYFKTDYSVKGAIFDLKYEALISAIAGRLREGERKIEVHLPDFYRLTDAPPLLTKLADAHQSAVKLQSLIKRLAQEIVETVSKDVDKAQVDPTLRKAKGVIETSEVLLAAFDSFSKSLTAASSDKTPSRLAQAVRRQKVSELKDCHLLYLSIQSSVGEAITSKSRLEKADRIRFVAGVAACYVLAKPDGMVLGSGDHVEIAKWDCPLSGEDRGLFGSLLCADGD